MLKRGIKTRNKIFQEAASFFIAPLIDFSSYKKLHFLLPLRECVYVGSLLNNHSLLLRTLFITSTTLLILLSIKQSDTSHPPLCRKEYLSSVSIIGSSVRQIMTYYIYVYSFKSFLCRKVTGTALRGSQMKCCVRLFVSVGHMGTRGRMGSIYVSKYINKYNDMTGMTGHTEAKCTETM